VVPLGGIINWSGAIVNIPDGYQICDGTNGTPDLRNRMIVGAGQAYAVDDTGGSATHLHAYDNGVHAHSVLPFDNVASGLDAQVWSTAGPGGITNPTSIAGNTDATNTLPPYYALAFIQRMV